MDQDDAPMSSINGIDDDGDFEETTFSKASSYDMLSPASPPQSVGGRKTQWATSNDTHFQPIGRSCAALIPDAYTIEENNGQIIFCRFDLKTDNLLLLPGTVITEVVNEIDKFWDLYDHYKKFKINHKRGIILGGPAGSGKSCTLKMVAENVINRGGIVIQYTNPELLLAGIKAFREIQPTTPIVVLMEDLDAIVSQSRHGQSVILNILDGVLSDALDRIVFMATTNYFEILERRLTNRPSRFDRIFIVENPNSEARLCYLQHLLKNDTAYSLDLKKVAAETDGLSFAHLKELVTSVVIMGNKYEVVLAIIQKMAEDVLPTGDEMESPRHKKKIGFRKHES